jgi:hypothetical protein
VEWADDEQGLTYGWLWSRTPTQYLTARSRITAAKLEMLPPGPDGAPRVKNLLGAKVEQLILCDAEGRLWGAAGLHDQAEAALLAEEGQFRQAIADAAKAQELVAVERPDPGLFGGYYSYGARTTLTSAGLLENSLAAALSKTPGPGSYVALVDRSPEFSAGLESYRDVGRFQVIVGRFGP